MDIRDFAEKFNKSKKVVISELSEGTIIYMLTENSLYTLKVVQPETRLVLVSGGYFNKKGIEPFLTNINGSTLGGSMIFKGQLIEGLCCEFGNNVISSRIKKLYVQNIN